LCPFSRAQEELNRIIYLPKSKETTYETLNRISKITDYMFIYDSNIINNNKKVTISAGEYTIRQAIRNTVNNETIGIRVIDKHILLFKQSNQIPEEKTKPGPIPESLHTVYTLEGIVRDKETREPIPYVSVSIPETGTGTVANLNGQFQIKLSDSLNNLNLQFSHVGYITKTFASELFSEGKPDIYLETHIIPIQEVLIGIVNPQKIVRDMLEYRTINYAGEPVYLTSFYREGIERKKGFVNLAEAVFKIYKTPYDSKIPDQVKLLKMRKISNTQIKDSILLKMRAGIDASLLLDLVKNLPDFLTLNNGNPYNYTKIDMAVTDTNLAHIIAFEQKKEYDHPLFKGELYIDAENHALLTARFEVNPRYVEQAANVYIAKKSKEYDIRPQQVNYTVSYKYWNGKYYINHIRGDLDFKVKKKKQFLARTSVIHTYFEMATCKIDTSDVKRFPGKESLSSKTIFSETRFTYDESFWGDFNVILAEDELSESIARISSKIEEEEE
jgi:hypothetical protein